MANRGRPKIPLAIKMQRSSYVLHSKEEQPEYTYHRIREMPQMPEPCQGDDRLELIWSTACSQLLTLDLLYETKVAQLHRWIEWYQVFYRCQDELMQIGFQDKISNQLLMGMHRAEGNIKRLEHDLHLSAIGMNGIEANTGQAKKELEAEDIWQLE